MNKIMRAQRRARRIREKMRGVSLRPRLSVYRSNKFIYAQIIDDTIGKTLVGVSEQQLEKAKGTKSEKAKAVGLLLAQVAKEKKIKAVSFDKGQYKYHGRIKSLADGAREGGLEF
ncbi:MAG TPA: 50S ribosomal protein L18 [Patescibacteria group bacterium]|nr:50S ribosomal protein L18 [Patescibacteria group bacterium]